MVRFTSLLILLGISACDNASRREKFPDRVLFSPDGSRVIFGALGDIYTMGADGSGLTRLTKTPEHEDWPAFSPDGKYVVYVAKTHDGRGQIYVMNADGSNPKQLTRNALYDWLPSFSPDGSKIVFVRAHRYREYSMGGYVWDDLDIYVMNADGSGEKRLTQNNYYMMSAPYFSPDGKYIIFSAEDGKPNSTPDIFLLDAGGRHPPQRLTHSPCYNTEPFFSPDGKRIVFISDRAKPYYYDVWIMNADGTRPRQVTRLNPQQASPVFAPDGKSILFLSETDLLSGRYDLLMVGPDGKHLRLLKKARDIVSSVK